MSLIELMVRGDGPTWPSPRRPRGVPLVRVMSASEARDVRGARGGVVIAIRSPGEPAVPLQSGWRDVLRLEIADVDVYGNLSPGEDVVVASRQIAAFLGRHRQATSYLFHCHAGLSRSRSVAAAVCGYRNWPYRWTVLHSPLHEAVGEALRELSQG